MAKKSSKAAPVFRPDGALDIQRVTERSEELTAALRQPGIKLDLSAVTQCDTAGLQLICSARRSTQDHGREWRPSNVSAAVLRACAEVGIQPENLGL